MLRTRQLPHPPKRSLGPLTIALLGLVGGGAGSAFARDWLPVGTQGSIREVKAHGHYKIVDGELTTIPEPDGNGDEDRADPVTYEWQWDGLGTGPDATFTQAMDLVLSGMTVSAGNGVYSGANRSVKISLYNEWGDALAGNPTPFSDFVSVNGPDADDRDPDNQTYPLTTTLSPAQTLAGNKLLVTVKSEAASKTLIGPAGPQLTGEADAGLQKATPSTRTLTYTP